MNNKGSATAWAVAFLAVVGLVASLIWAFTLQGRVESLKVAVADSQQQAQSLLDQAQRQKDQVRQLEQTVGKLEESLSSAKGAAPEEATPEAAAAETANAEADQSGGKDNPMAKMYSKMFEGDQGKKMAEASADAVMAMQYGDLFTQLTLPPETEQKVRELLRNYMVKGIQAAGEFMNKKDGTPDAAKKFEKDMDAELRKELAKVLTPEELAAYDEYEAGAEERVLRKSFEMQLGMFAPSLSEENRTMVVDVMTEEMLALDQQYGSLGSMAGPDAIKNQLGALDRSRERLATVLDEQQLQQVDGFINQTKMGIEMFMNMMSDQKKPAEEKKP